MGKYLDFDNQEKGFEAFNITRESALANKGRLICYVDFVEPYRGAYFVRYGRIHSIKRSKLFLDDGERFVDIRDIKESGIECLDNHPQKP